MTSCYGHSPSYRTRSAIPPRLNASLLAASARCTTRTLSPARASARPTTRVQNPTSRCRSRSLGSIGDRKTTSPSQSPHPKRQQRSSSVSEALYTQMWPSLDDDHDGAVYQPLTPPASSQVALAVAPCIPEPYVPETLDETIDRINAFLKSGETMPLSMTLSHNLWYEFIHHRWRANHSDPLFRLRYTYNYSTTTLITKCMASPIHDAVQTFFDAEVKTMIYERRLRPDESMRFSIESNTEVGLFTGDREGDRKQADLSIVPQNNDVEESVNGDFPLIAVEVGFSESYERLKKDTELWLEGSEGKVRVVVVICLTETPAFRSEPFVYDDESDFEVSNDTQPVRDGGESVASAPVAAEEQHRAPPPYGPLLHSGRILVGEITGFVELWRNNADTSTAELKFYKEIFPEPPPGEDADDHFVLTMLDLFGCEEKVPASCGTDDPVLFQLATYRKAVSKAVRKYGRIRLMLAEKAKRQVMGDDGEWNGGKRNRAMGDDGEQNRGGKRRKVNEG